MEIKALGNAAGGKSKNFFVWDTWGIMKINFLYGLVLFSLLDIGYTAIGLFFVGGNELNPMYSFMISDPVLMLGLVCVVKILSIGSFLLVVHHLSKTDKSDRDRSITDLVLLWGCCFYFLLLSWCAYLNVPYLMSLI